MEIDTFKKHLYKFIHLISSYLKKDKLNSFSLSKDEESFFYNLSKRHSLRSILYRTIKFHEISISKEMSMKLEECYLNNVRKTVLFEKEKNDLFKFLNDEKIDFLPIKGSSLSALYPDSYVREFSDCDILFHSKDKTIKHFFTKQGYIVKSYRKTNHDIYLKPPFYNFEMHRALFSKSNFAFYFKNYLKASHIKKGFEHCLTDNDSYIYFIAHTFKHFDYSGCGIRTLIDIYLLLNNTHLDFNYIGKEFDKIGLLDFSNRISKLSQKLFNNQHLDELEENMLLYIASSGTYGTLKNCVSNGIKRNGKLKYFLSRLFPPFVSYKNYYPWAFKCPLLIPVAWLCRSFRIMFCNPKRAICELMAIKNNNKRK